MMKFGEPMSCSPLWHAAIRYDVNDVCRTRSLSRVQHERMGYTIFAITVNINII